MESCQKNLTCYPPPPPSWQLDDVGREGSSWSLDDCRCANFDESCSSAGVMFLTDGPIFGLRLNCVLKKRLCVLKVSMHFVLVLMLALCHDCH